VRPASSTTDGSADERIAPIVERFRQHYAETFARHGATSQGVDWGDPAKLPVRYAKMLEVIEPDCPRPLSLLDVGCGYGGLLTFARQHAVTLDYTGIDVVPEMIESARRTHPDAEFVSGDVLALSDERTFDYVVCNGILTLKLETSLRDMDRFARRLIRTMFSLARRGIAFNLMSTHVDYFGPNGYHKSPVEMLAFCAGELSSRVRLDHSYAPFEYTVYVYRPAETPTAGRRPERAV